MAIACPPRVLFIDNDPSVREIVSSIFAAFGYDCQAADRRSGPGRFNERDWDLVLSDLTMPSSWEVIETIRQRAPTIPVVLMTGLSDPAVLRRAHDCHVAVIVKPFQVQTLMAALVEALYAARLAWLIGHGPLDRRPSLRGSPISDHDVSFKLVRRRGDPRRTLRPRTRAPTGPSRFVRWTHPRDTLGSAVAAVWRRGA